METAAVWPVSERWWRREAGFVADQIHLTAAGHSRHSQPVVDLLAAE